MLVLSRKQTESLWINGNVFVTVLEIRGNKVRLGIEAPKDTPVHRGEVYERIKGRPGVRPIAFDADHGKR
jgi:carbon storage regulator